MPDEKDWKLGASYPELGQGLGCLHEAHHPDTGAPGLVLTSDGRVDWGLEDSWRVSLSCQSDPATVKVLVEEAPAEGEVTALANMFVLVSGAVTRVEDDPRLREHLTARPVARALGWRGRARAWARSWRGRAVAGAGVLALGAGLHGFQLACSAARVNQPLGGDDPFLENPSYIDSEGLGSTAITYPLPAKPFDMQALPPCKTTMGEEEINGGCWLDTNQKPPCYANRAEYKGKCYMPIVRRKARPGQVVDP